MNNRSERVNARIRKKITKNVRAGQKLSATAVAEQPTIRNTRGQNPAKPAKKGFKNLLGNLREMRDSFRKKLGKGQSSKRSKRTNPGDVPNTSSPKHPHIEGERWAKTTTKQSLLKSKLLNKKLSKQK